MGEILPNHGYVNLSLVGTAIDGSDSVQCHTDLSSCCSGAQGADRGDWYFPSGDRLQFPSNQGDIYEIRRSQQVDIRRRNNGDTSGIYCCAIETNAARSDNITDITTRETVYVGLYSSGGVCDYCFMLTLIVKRVCSILLSLFIITTVRKCI